MTRRILLKDLLNLGAIPFALGQDYRALIGGMRELLILVVNYKV
jgi:hypothetical protein